MIITRKTQHKKEPLKVAEKKQERLMNWLCIVQLIKAKPNKLVVYKRKVLNCLLSKITPYVKKKGEDMLLRLMSTIKIVSKFLI